MNHIDYNNFILEKNRNFNEQNSILIETSSDDFRLGTHLVRKSKENLYVIYYYMENNISTIYFQGFDIYIVYIELESIVMNILSKYDLIGKNYNIIDRPSFNLNEKTLKYNLEKIKKENIEKIANEFITFYKQKALPFFEKWKDLNVLYEYIKDKTEEELWDILGQFAPMKKAVILKLCNDSNYQEFMDSYFQKQKEYFDEDPEDIDNIRYYNASKELKQVLDNTEPIYNV
ncbi:hypothetical protein HMPREF1321_0187 [Capnocytophaga sp. oral taxon 412 str. F0487]|uniref:hypothetical protein n=1 Tax=Capnocytophaga sp. oral taxon 412 TaxID=712218 RepID=UPI00026975BD|nr:hypothetical protein [Capnocytophaga sp. oral taxon 412]EIW92086.1 hypothetical protein HMPREF1321_0187 [Capnocytophaga sp. oral taxon 412 str. F0487]